MDEDGGGLEPVAISALEHWSYCPRQCGLIHLEQTYDENYYTLKGSVLHARVDAGKPTTERGVRVLRDQRVWSERLGLIGKADVVELHGDVVYPVEYKSGSYREWDHEAIQLCALAMCLEEMLGVSVPRGAVSYLASRQRREVVFDAALHDRVREATRAVRTMLANERLPDAQHDNRCRACSLATSCMPTVLVRPARLRTAARSLFTRDGEE